MNHHLDIFQVEPDDIESVHSIIRSCGEDMQLRLNLNHWMPPIPIESMRKDAELGNVYAVSDNKKIIATFTISTEPLSYYNDALWEYPEQRAIYMSHLAVLPSYQLKGIGTWCMKKIEQLAKAKNCSAIRLDAYIKYEKSLEFYDNLGYARREIIPYKDIILQCFEKVLNKN